jgi:putative phosphoribosyl transferase
MNQHRSKEVRITVEDVILNGNLALPERAQGIVIFAHGSGSSRLSPRNTFVAAVMQRAGLGTLLFDLLTHEEDYDYARRFDIPLLARRLQGATHWLRTQPEVGETPLGYFGASTGAAAALQAAALDGTIKAVVSRGGRPDMAISYLDKVFAPTLLIVGEHDREVLRLNGEAYARLPAIKELAVVPGATHLFDEPGTLEQAANLAKAWFLRHLH